MKKLLNKDETGVRYLLAALGNVGKEYEATYHNAGFMLADWLADHYGSTWSSAKKLKSDIARIRIQNADIFVIKPTTLMNRSGDAAESVASYYAIPKTQIICAHDDSDILLGSYKVQRGGGAAGHKGVLSLYRSLSTQTIWRIRIGIRPQPREGGGPKAGTFVLKKMAAAHQATTLELFPHIWRDVEKTILSPENQ